MAYYDEGEETYMAGIGTHAIPLNQGVMKYDQKRREEFPDIREQLDDLFKAGAFSTAMTARIQAVKDRYPKQTDAEWEAILDAFYNE